MKNWKAELKTMMLDGRWSEAVVLMQNIIKNTPDNPGCIFEYGLPFGGDFSGGAVVGNY